MPLPQGFRVGHWTDTDAITGCTVILCQPSTIGACDVRGSSPGTRETALLAPDKTMQEVHAVLLTGGSAFGLAAADGVVSYLEENGIGYHTPWMKVPIVPAAVIFDLNIGRSDVRPNAASGYLACKSASSGPVEEVTVGAGTGATVGKWAGPDTRVKGGVGFAEIRHDALSVAAVAVVNAVGDILDESGSIVAGACTADGKWLALDDPLRILFRTAGRSHTNTTLVVLMTNARLTKVETSRMAQRGHNGMARAIKPVHTSFDGDIVFALSSGNVEGNFDLIAEMGADAVSAAIRSGVKAAKGLGGVRASSEITRG